MLNYFSKKFNVFIQTSDIHCKRKFNPSIKERNGKFHPSQIWLIWAKFGKSISESSIGSEGPVAKVFETEDCASNDVIIDSLHNPDLQVIVLGHVTPYKL